MRVNQNSEKTLAEYTSLIPKTNNGYTKILELRNMREK